MSGVLEQHKKALRNRHVKVFGVCCPHFCLTVSLHNEQFTAAVVLSILSRYLFNFANVEYWWSILMIGERIAKIISAVTCSDFAFIERRKLLVFWRRRNTNANYFIGNRTLGKCWKMCSERFIRRSEGENTSNGIKAENISLSLELWVIYWNHRGVVWYLVRNKDCFRPHEGV